MVKETTVKARIRRYERAVERRPFESARDWHERMRKELASANSMNMEAVTVYGLYERYEAARSALVEARDHAQEARCSASRYRVAKAWNEERARLEETPGAAAYRKELAIMWGKR